MSSEKHPVVEIKNLTKKYGSLVAVNHLNLEINEGEIFGLLGPNGSGKTTTINSALGLVRYQEGDIYIFGKKLSENSKEIKKNVGVIMQEVAVFNELTVYENIEYFCSLYVKNKGEITRLTKEAIRFVALEEYTGFYPQKLSGGLLRRLNIACGIVHKPKLIILDEPTVAVDPQSRNKILEGIIELNRRGATIIYTTHYMEEVEQICSRIAIIDKGEVIALGTKQELKESIQAGETIEVEAENLSQEIVDTLSGMGKFKSVELNNNVLTMRTKKDGVDFMKIMDWLKSRQIGLKKVYTEMPTLNDVFLEITGKELRD